jgi:TolB protein
MPRRAKVLMLVAVLTALSAGVPTQAAATFPGPDGLIAFARGGASGDIYTMRADGSAITQVNSDIGADYFPQWSPDGTKILFSTDRNGGNNEVYVMNADGSAQTNLTSNPAYDDVAEWSPDGTKIVFSSSNRDEADFDIYTMNADGTGVSRLTTDPARDYGASWSPDGNRIAFSSYRAGGPGIYTMNPDGSDVTSVTGNQSSGGAPDWSPDGGKIGFGSNGELYVINPDGSGLSHVAAGLTFNWSPSGTRIASEYLDTQRDIYVMNADGSNRTNITNSAPDEANPSWGTVAGPPGDTTPPSVTLTAPANNASTHDPTPALRGTGGTAAGDSAAVTIKIYQGAGTSGPVIQTRTATRDATTGAYARAATTLPDGLYTARAQQDDAAGNTGYSSANTFTVDTVAPVVSLSAPANGSSIHDATPALAGTGGTAPGDSATVRVKIYRGTDTSGPLDQTRTATRDPGTGDYSVDAKALADGSYTASAQQTDAAGNTGFSSANTFSVMRTFLVADSNAFGGSGGVLRVTAQTGARTTVSRNSSPAGATSFADPTGIAAEAGGGILVADPNAFGGSGGVIRVDPQTGVRTTVSRNSSPAGATSFADPTGIAVEAGGGILVADPNAFGGSGGVIRVDPQTGVRTTVSRNTSPSGAPAFADPTGIAVEAGGGIVVGDPNAFSGVGGVIRVDPQTGVRTALSSNSTPPGGPAFADPSGLAPRANGNVIVADSNTFGGSGGVIRVNGQTGARGTVSRNTNPAGAPLFADPLALSLDDNGNAAVADPGVPGVIGVDLQTGARTTVSSNSSPAGAPSFVRPVGIAVEQAP